MISSTYINLYKILTRVTFIFQYQIHLTLKLHNHLHKLPTPNQDDEKGNQMHRTE